jgi:hypothetical protein
MFNFKCSTCNVHACRYHISHGELRRLKGRKFISLQVFDDWLIFGNSQ